MAFAFPMFLFCPHTIFQILHAGVQLRVQEATTQRCPKRLVFPERAENDNDRTTIIYAISHTHLANRFADSESTANPAVIWEGGSDMGGSDMA